MHSRQGEHLTIHAPTLAYTSTWDGPTCAIPSLGNPPSEEMVRHA
jgi:hypothetical protein